MITADSIWNIIVSNGLCHPDGKDVFMDFYYARNINKVFSYRLNCPLLGRGCKIWQDGKSLWIDAFREDITDAKQLIIDKVNKELEDLMKG